MDTKGPINPISDGFNYSTVLLVIYLLQELLLKTT